MTSISWSPGTEFVRSRLGVSAAATGADEHAPSRIRSEPSMPLGALQPPSHLHCGVRRVRCTNGCEVWGRYGRQAEGSTRHPAR